MKYVNKQNGKVMEILKQDEKKGTMLIQFEDGKSTSITTGTFKRWYKKVEDNVATEIETPVNEPDKTVVDGVTDEEYIQEVMNQKKELGIECPPITEVEVVEAGDGTPLAEVGKEIAEQAKAKAELATKALEVVKKMPAKKVVEEVRKVIKKEKAKKEKAPKQDVEATAQELTTLIEKCGFTTHRTSGAPRNMYIGLNGKNSYGLYIGGSKCVLGMPGNRVPEGFTASRVRNCPHSHTFDFAYSELNKLENILKAIKEEK